MEPEPPGAASFCLEPEPTQVGRSRSRLRDLGHLEPEPPKKVVAPQHCNFSSLVFTPPWIRIQICVRIDIFGILAPDSHKN